MSSSRCGLPGRARGGRRRNGLAALCFCRYLNRSRSRPRCRRRTQTILIVEGFEKLKVPAKISADLLSLGTARVLS